MYKIVLMVDRRSGQMTHQPTLGQLGHNRSRVNCKIYIIYIIIINNERGQLISIFFLMLYLTLFIEGNIINKYSIKGKHLQIIN